MHSHQFDENSLQAGTQRSTSATATTSNCGGSTKWRLTVHWSIARSSASRYFSGNAGGSTILMERDRTATRPIPRPPEARAGPCGSKTPRGTRRRATLPESEFPWPKNAVPVGCLPDANESDGPSSQSGVEMRDMAAMRTMRFAEVVVTRCSESSPDVHPGSGIWIICIMRDRKLESNL